MSAAMTFLIILIILIVCWPWISRYLRRWVNGFMARRAEDMMRRMMGMPSRREEERRRKAGRREKGRESGFRDAGTDANPSSRRGGRRQRGHRQYPRGHVAAMLQAVAIDTDFIEIREFSSSTIAESDGQTVTFTYEEQITDVRFTEIKGSRP